MKQVYGCAGILKQGNRICALRRKFGDFAGYYEFPGGKVEIGETAEEAVIRECKEELDVTVRVLSLVDIIHHDYPGFHLKMPLYLCEIMEGEMKLSVHDDLVWLDELNVSELNWIEATRLLVPKIKNIVIELQRKEG
ncbi:MAG: (deoxy)nucleoside triphosphate pyrophosphohydrolase [Erysipelotrichaceae bacterium]|nr:(deoxy)nucleoside triphosphate pyrophosphohydrolase [Erysipelotrichaceae bacterium]